MIEPSNPEYAAAAAAQQKYGGDVFEYNNIFFRTVRDNDIIRFAPIARTPERSSYGTVMPNVFGVYFPTIEKG